MIKINTVIVMLLICLITRLMAHHENWHHKDFLLKLNQAKYHDHG